MKNYPLSKDDPLDDKYLDYLIERGYETSYLDFKFTLNLSGNDFASIAKTFFAMANTGGGYILIGFREAKKTTEALKSNKRFQMVGLEPNLKLDQADIQGKFDSYSEQSHELLFKQFFRQVGSSTLEFAAIFVPGATEILIPKKDGYFLSHTGKRRKAFSKGCLLVRRGTRTIEADARELKFIKEKIEQQRYEMSLLSGEPDEIEEVITSNMFRILDIPEFVYTIRQFEDTEVYHYDDPHSLKAAFRVLGEEIITLVDPSSSKFVGRMDIAESVPKREGFISWCQDENNLNVVKDLFVRDLEKYCRTKEIRYDWKSKRFYYYSESGVLSKEWSSRRGRKSERRVVFRLPSIFGTYDGFVNLSFRAKFIFYSDGEIYLTLIPGYALTIDGVNLDESPEVGHLITRLNRKMYNDLYLNHLSFITYWLSAGKDSYVTPSGIKISSKAVDLTLNRGIIWDSAQYTKLNSNEEFDEGGAIDP